MTYQPYTQEEREQFMTASFAYAESQRKVRREVLVRLHHLIIAAPDYTEVMDISHWQNDGQQNGIIDFWALYESGVRGVYIKATEADGWTDPYFEQNWNGALETPLMVAPFHLFRGNKDGLAQADHFLTTIQPLLDAVINCILPPMGDFETKDGTGQLLYQKRAYAFLSAVKVEVKQPVMYSSAWLWNSLVGNAGWEDEFHQWVAHWTSGPEPIIPYAWLRALLIYWQWCVCPKYSWCAPCPFQLSGSWDLDRYYGTETELKALAGYSNGGNGNGNGNDDVWLAIEDIKARLDKVESDMADISDHTHHTGGPL